ncbi:ferrochelatase [Vibrio marisflavi]|uniref:Ferrochelatase n=1 Tax=Vibrio marisflavi CECT 7928 TaxID=634439 RepID=A0ABN8E1X7_9VIBR|nr:ferrochelatase [Vibrio marisflavi]CAH0539045.1 Ferrochelatase [Vibrio marisflavi CECT 7928]
MENSDKKGVLLVNLGTPDAPTAPAVKKFLGQFLHDKRVVDMSRLLWCPILHGVILPIRSPKVAKSYQTIWMEEGSPLMVHSKNQAAKLQNRLGYPVELGMTYGSPSVESGISKLLSQGVEQIVILPLYPQYSNTTTAAALDAVSKVVKRLSTIPSYRFIRDYCSHPSYIKALAASVRKSWDEQGKGDYLLCSYHGIPKRFADNGDIYPKQCELTTHLLAQELGLTSEQIGFAYQSRFGREEWLKPYTDKVLEELSGKGIQTLDVIAPAFSVDCLETLEEISEQYQELFVESGGKQFRYIPCLNDDDEHIEMMRQLVL